MSMQKPSTADRTMAGDVIARSRRSPIEEEASLLALEARYCAHGDSVHHAEPPKIFDQCEGSYLYDIEGRQFLDLQMWHSAVNFGYANRRLNDALKRQLNRLPQIDEVDFGESVMLKGAYFLKGLICDVDGLGLALKLLDRLLHRVTRR